MIKRNYKSWASSPFIYNHFIYEHFRIERIHSSYKISIQQHQHKIYTSEMRQYKIHKRKTTFTEICILLYSGKNHYSFFTTFHVRSRQIRPLRTTFQTVRAFEIGAETSPSIFRTEPRTCNANRGSRATGLRTNVECVRHL